MSITKQHTRLFFKSLKLQPFSVNLSISLNREIRGNLKVSINPNHLVYNIIALLISTLSLLTDLSDAPLRFSALHSENCSGTTDIMQRSVVGHYMKQVCMQARVQE